MNRTVKLSFWSAAFIGTAALAAYIVDQFDPARLRIAKLRLAAWKASRDLPYGVSIRRRSVNLSGVAATYKPYWTWVSIIGDERPELGPVDTLELSEALQLAREQWKERKRGRAPARPNDPPPLVSGAKLAHRMSYTPIDGDRMRIDCTCGKFQTRPTEEGHHFEPGCAPCDDVIREWEEHAGTERPGLVQEQPTQAVLREICIGYYGFPGGTCRRCGLAHERHPAPERAYHTVQRTDQPEGRSTV